MKKIEAIKLFGSGAALGRALGLSRGRIAQWNDVLTKEQTDRVVGAAVRKGLIRIESSDKNANELLLSIQPQSNWQEGGNV